MRKDVLKRFAAGTCSVCMLYALSYSAVEALAGGAAESAPAVVATATSTAAATPAPTSSAQCAAESGFPTYNDGYSGRHGRGRSSWWSGETVLPNESAYDAESADSSGQTITSGSGSGTQVTDSNSPTNSSQTITSGDDTTGSSPPTLNQYLSALRCSGCRRNCLLINPRCMNGRSKAETATTAYYEQYSDS